MRMEVDKNEGWKGIIPHVKESVLYPEGTVEGS